MYVHPHGMHSQFNIDQPIASGLTCSAVAIRKALAMCYGTVLIGGFHPKMHAVSQSSIIVSLLGFQTPKAALLSDL